LAKSLADSQTSLSQTSLSLTSLSLSLGLRPVLSLYQ